MLLAARSHSFLAKRGKLRGLLALQGLTVEMSLSILPDDHPNREILGLEMTGVDRYAKAFLKVHGDRDGEFLGRVEPYSAADIGWNNRAALRVDSGYKSHVRCCDVPDELHTVIGPDDNGLGRRRVNKDNRGRKSRGGNKGAHRAILSGTNLRNV